MSDKRERGETSFGAVKNLETITKAILEKDTLTSADVRDYLQAHRDLFSANPSKINSPNDVTILLDHWDCDRYDAFSFFLEQAHFSSPDQQESVEAYIRCCLFLISEPLILSKDSTSYGSLIDSSYRRSNLLIKLFPSEKDFFDIYLLGLMMNAHHFCSEVLSEETNNEIEKYEQDFFSKTLNTFIYNTDEPLH